MTTEIKLKCSSCDHEETKYSAKLVRCKVCNVLYNYFSLGEFRNKWTKENEKKLREKNNSKVVRTWRLKK